MISCDKGHMGHHHTQEVLIVENKVRMPFLWQYRTYKKVLLQVEKGEAYI